jgi:hypothetical protein
VDDRISVLRRQWLERKQTYSKLGIPIVKHKGDDEKMPLTQRAAKRLAAHKIAQRMKAR